MHACGSLKETVGVEHDASGGIGAEYLIMRRPELNSQPHSPEGLHDLVPVCIPGDHHLLDAGLHLNPLDPCQTLTMSTETVTMCYCHRVNIAEFWITPLTLDRHFLNLFSCNATMSTFSSIVCGTKIDANMSLFSSTSRSHLHGSYTVMQRNEIVARLLPP